MESLKEVIKLLDFDIIEMLNKIVLSFSDKIIEFNQDDQLDFGIDARGNVIKTLMAKSGDVYSAYTVSLKKAKGLQTNKVDLKDSGKFWKTFKVIQTTKGFEIKANFDLYQTNILDNFDSKYDFLGLIPPNLKDLILNDVFPELDKQIRAKLKI